MAIFEIRSSVRILFKCLQLNQSNYVAAHVLNIKDNYSLTYHLVASKLDKK